ncbi:hypothetical protein JHK87_036901 [Glycine soja]|nr:hypothetical protein JHK87_036901 [Glycine soja]
MEAVKMVGLRRLIRQRSSLRDSLAEKVHSPVPSQHLARLTPKRFFDLHQGLCSADEMTRGYFADMAEFKKHAGKIAVANKLIIPAMVATKFPDFEVSFTDGKTMKLPIRVSDRAVDSDKSSVPKASLVCLSFRASSQEMINSWSVPFTEAFRKSNDVHLYQRRPLSGLFIEKPHINTRERKLKKLLPKLSLVLYNGGGWSGVEQPLESGHHCRPVPEFVM